MISRSEKYSDHELEGKSEMTSTYPMDLNGLLHVMLGYDLVMFCHVNMYIT